MKTTQMNPLTFNKHLGDWETFYNENINLVYSVVNSFKNRLRYNWELEEDDLISVGTLGLFKAYLNYNPDEFENSYATYAFHLIKGEIMKLFRDFHPRGMKVSREVRKVYWKITNQNFGSLSDKEIAEMLETSEEIVQQAKILAHQTIVSKDQEQDAVKKTSKTQDTDITYENDMCFSEDYSNLFVEEFMNLLTSRERIIVELKLQGKSQEEIGKIIGLSQVQISKIMRHKIKPKLMDYLEGLDVKRRKYVLTNKE